MVPYRRRRWSLGTLMATLLLGLQLGSTMQIPVVAAAPRLPVAVTTAAPDCGRAERTWWQKVQYYITKGFTVLWQGAEVQGAHKDPGPQEVPAQPRYKYLPLVCPSR